MAAENRKAAARIGLEVLVTIVPEGDRAHLGKSKNLSTSGMLLEIARPLDVGIRVELKLFIPSTGKRLSIEGEITRDAGQKDDVYCYGVRFIDLPVESKVEISKFLLARGTKSE